MTNLEKLAELYEKDPEEVDKDLEEAFNKTYPEWLNTLRRSGGEVMKILKTSFATFAALAITILLSYTVSLIDLDQIAKICISGVIGTTMGCVLLLNIM